eukprot:1387299-Pyramimonas_sp.AAC.1
MGGEGGGGMTQYEFMQMNPDAHIPPSGKITGSIVCATPSTSSTGVNVKLPIALRSLAARGKS